MIKKKSISFLRSEEGWVSPFSLIMLASMLSVLGIAIEYANIIRAKTQIQTASDATALAAAQSLDDETTAQAYGMEVANLYFGGEDNNVTIQNSDIELGTWDADAQEFTASVVSINAVRVSAEMSSTRGNALVTAFSGLTGLGAVDINVQSVALTGSTAPQTNVCESGGLFAAGTLYTGNNNSYQSGACTYGITGVDIGNANTYASQSSLSGGYSATFASGNSNVCAGDTCDLQRPDSADGNFDFTLTGEVGNMVTALQSGDTSSLYNGGSYSVSSVSSLPRRNKFSSYTLYIVNGDAEFPSNGTYENIAVVATGNIKAGSNTTFDNVYLATNADIRFGSNTTYGPSDYCNDGRYHVYLFAGDDINFGANNTFQGMQMAAGDDISFGSNVTAVGDVHGEALGDIDYGTNIAMNNCTTALDSDFGWQPELIDDGDPEITYALVM